MHYKESFYITKPVWNNAFSFEKRELKKIFVPSIIEINNINEIQIWKEIVFIDYDFDWNIKEEIWLKNFYKINIKNKTIYFFDNHNHAFYFWHLARFQKIIWDNALLIHIDEHSDMRDPWVYLEEKDSYDLDKVFNYTNFELNVWNYIIPALKTWIIKDIIQIRNTINLQDYLIKKDYLPENIILNLDLDFFSPWLDFIDFNLKKQVILDAFNRSNIITVSTSPFFINQNLAIETFKKLFI